MAEGSLASAVAFPEPEPAPLPPSPPSEAPGQKRRPSETNGADGIDVKRRRLSSQQDDGASQLSPREERRPSSPAPPPAPAADADRRPSRRMTGKEEERRRGQRLFGALLGTLSQGTSNSVTQKRRADIDRRQQDKLKLQDEEYGELRKKKREEILAVRRREQKVYECEAMRTRHENLLAMAHFLKTKTKPVLYYKPWELRREDEDIIQDQIDDAKEIIAREEAELDARLSTDERNESAREEPDGPVDNDRQPSGKPTQADPEAQAPAETETIASGSYRGKSPDIPTADAAPPSAASDQPVAAVDHAEQRGAEDDGGEVMEDNEDTVIY